MEKRPLLPGTEMESAPGAWARQDLGFFVGLQSALGPSTIVEVGLAIAEEGEEEKRAMEGKSTRPSQHHGKLRGQGGVYEPSLGGQSVGSRN